MTLDRALFRLWRRYGFLRRPCRECGQNMVVARSGKRCLNCHEVNG